MKYDYAAIYNKNAAFYNGHGRLKKALLLCNLLLTYLFLIAYAGLWVYALLKDELLVTDYAKFFFIPATSLLTVSVLRLAIDKPRPYSEKGAHIQPILRGKREQGHSFPSRHIASATAISFTFLPYLPAVGGVLLVCTLALAYTRFAVGVHYPSDLLAGIGVGGFFGIFVFFL